MALDGILLAETIDKASESVEQDQTARMCWQDMVADGKIWVKNLMFNWNFLLNSTPFDQEVKKEMGNKFVSLLQC